MTNTKNVYSKLQECRVRLNKANLKKSGKNNYAKYNYYELSDILPAMNEILCDIGLCTVLSFTTETATMRIVNSDNPSEEILFSSPMSTAEIKGGQMVQNLGAVQTYLHRYLIINAFEISEGDVLDSTHNPSEAISAISVRKEIKDVNNKPTYVSNKGKEEIPSVNPGSTSEKCPMCGGSMILKPTKTGGKFWACSVNGCFGKKWINKFPKPGLDNKKPITNDTPPQFDDEDVFLMEDTRLFDNCKAKV
jgi:hypothetical protein